MEIERLLNEIIQEADVQITYERSTRSWTVDIRDHVLGPARFNGDSLAGNLNAALRFLGRKY